MNRNKQGITVAVLVTIVLVILLLTTTITISVRDTLKSSNLRAFVTELSTIQDTIYTYNKTTTAVDYVIKDITITPPNDVISTQFYGENITDGKVILHVIDLEKIGLKKTVYGKSKTTTDVYAVSFETGKVYYVEGYDASDMVYYTLTEELEKLLPGYIDDDFVSDNVVFTPNRVGWTNQPIQVKISIPVAVDITTVSVTTSVDDIAISEHVLNGAYNQITVNTGNYAGNYTISVQYGTKSQDYEVVNYDNTPPTITVGEVRNDNDNITYKYLNDVIATDLGKIKKIMYADIVLTEEQAEKYFRNNGSMVSNSRVRLNNTSAKYTTYAEDYAGNISTLIVDNKFWAALGDRVNYTPTANPTENYTGATYVKDTDSESTTYNTYIESTTNYTPGTLKWVYLGQDENGNMLLTSRETTAFTMTVAGQDGYVTGPDRMDTLCNTLYGNSAYGQARNMKIEDVNRVIGYDGPKGYYFDADGNRVWTETPMKFGDVIVSIKHNKVPRLSKIAFEDYLSNAYFYAGVTYIATTTTEYNLIYNEENSTTKLPIYWLSSACCSVFASNTGGYFDVRYVSGGSAYSRDLFWSFGGEGDASYSLRPVIVLNSNVQLGEKNAAGEWTLVVK